MAQSSQGAALAAVLAPSSTPAPTPATAASQPSVADRIAEATKLWATEPAGAPATSADSFPATTAASPAPEAPLPLTPVAPATTAVLEQQETASTLIRQRNELADQRRAFEAAQSKWHQEQAEHQQRLAAMERAFAEFETDPAAFARARGTKRPLAEIAKDIFIEDAEIDKLPPEQASVIRSQRDMRRMERSNREMTERLARAEQMQALATYRSQLAAGLPALSDTTPLVKSLAAADPQQLIAQLEEVAGQLALKNPSLGPQTTAQLAALLEPHLEKALEDTSKKFGGYFEKRYKPAAPAPVVPAVVTPAPARAEPSGDITSATDTRVKPLSTQERLAAATRAWG